MPYTPTVWKTGDIVSSEKLNKLEKGVADATSEEIIDSWLEENISQETGYVLDRTLTLQNAAAPADLVGAQSDKITQLQTATTADEFLLKNAYVDLKDAVYWKVGSIGSDGSISDDHSYSNMFTPALIRFPVIYDIKDQRIRIAKYKNGVFVSRTSNLESIGTIEFDSTFDAYRIIVTTPSASSYTVEQLLGLIGSISSAHKVAFDDVSGDVGRIEDGVPISFSAGVIGSNGSISSGTNDNYYSTEIKASDFKSIVVNADEGYLFSLCKYSGSTFIERSSWYKNEDGKIVVSNDYSYRINIAKSTASGSTVSQLLEHIYIEINGNDLQTIRRETAGIDFLNKIVCSDTGNKIIHYSVDDVWECLKDITDNTYESVFENTFLNTLKSLHETYGICVTLNCFNTYSEEPTYSIANLPSRYQTELRGCKSWLRFAFHAENDTSDYSTSSGILTAYNTFVNAIYTLTGDYGCIDSITRLGFYGGTLSSVLSIKEANHGIIGLLCADITNRDSYYLDSEQNAIVQEKGKYIDLKNEIIFIKTITRTLANAVAEIEGNLCYQKYVEIFMHEYENQNGFGTIAQWANQNGFVNAFPSTILG